MEFDELIKRISDIAKAVNAFSSESVQQQAFAALLNALDGGNSPHPTEQASRSSKESAKQKAAKVDATPNTAPKNGTVKKNSKKTGGPRIVTDLNLRPNGKSSLRDFVTEKGPNDNQKRFAVIIYYLQKKISTKNIDENHIYTAFKDIGVKVPLNIEGALSVAAKRKGWIDTSNLNDVKMTVGGENFVEHDLPAKPIKKK
jgi:hypothetical protein